MKDHSISIAISFVCPTLFKMATTTATTRITVSAQVEGPIDKVWEQWTDPKHIVKWNAASDDWHCPRSENDLRVGGRFSARMEPRNSNEGFDFSGTYTEVVPKKRIVHRMDDGRMCEVTFATEGNGTRVTETFDAEHSHSVEMQRGGWQAILDRFKAHVEGHRK